MEGKTFDFLYMGDLKKKAKEIIRQNEERKAKNAKKLENFKKSKLQNPEKIEEETKVELYAIDLRNQASIVLETICVLGIMDIEEAKAYQAAVSEELRK